MTLAAIVWSDAGPVRAISAPDGQRGELQNAGQAEADRRNREGTGERLGFNCTVVELTEIGDPRP